MPRQQASQQREGLLFEGFTSRLAVYMGDLVIGKRMLMVTNKWGWAGNGFICICFPASSLLMGMMVLMAVGMWICFYLLMRRGMCHTGLMMVVRHQVMHP